MGTRTRIVLGVVIIGAVLLAAAMFLQRGDSQAQARLIAETPDTTGFARVEGPPEFDFPEAHGPHPDYQTEWWYYTGNLDTADGRPFGYQLTFFRRALRPPAETADRASGWAADQVYMAHFALTDVAGREHHAFERFSRGAAGLAGAEAPPFAVWLEDWRVEQTGDDAYHLIAAADGIALELDLHDRKGPVLQGEQGYSRKGADPANASAYYSQTRLTARGEVRVGGEVFAVEGLSWMDHEYSTSALAEGQVGWDWFSIQLDDGSEFMLYTIRLDDGHIDPYSHGLYVHAGGSTERLLHRAGDYKIEVLDTWRSPHTGAEYPARWRVRIPGQNLTVELQPWLPDQEMNVSYAYWEGAVRVRGERDGEAVGGAGYVEMTGYAGSMEGQF